MMIIIEGADGAGKSTLVEAFRLHSPRYFWALRSSGPPKDETKVLDALLWFAKRPSEFDLVFDRHPAISEFIYGPILRGKNFLAKFSQTTLLNAVDAIVYCRPPMPKIIDNVRKSYQLSGVNEKIEKIVYAYDDMMFELGLKIPVILYDFTVHNPEHTVDTAWRAKRGFKDDSPADGTPVRTGSEVLIDRVEKSIRDESFDPS